MELGFRSSGFNTPHFCVHNVWDVGIQPQHEFHNLNFTEVSSSPREMLRHVFFTFIWCTKTKQTNKRKLLYLHGFLCLSIHDARWNFLLENIFNLKIWSMPLRQYFTNLMVEFDEYENSTFNINRQSLWVLTPNFSCSISLHCVHKM